jgi:phosphomannomutase
MRELNCIVGGELAGHYYFRDFFNCDSGLLTALIVLHIAAQRKSKGLPFSSEIIGLQRYANSGELNYPIEDKEAAMLALTETFRQQAEPTAVYEFDGVRMEFSDWWFNVRISQTESYLRLLIEADTPEILAKKRTAIEAVLREVT